jgi:ABC-type lipoprotein export system ATPase subunit
MLELNREFGTTTVLVTHDQELAQRARRIIRLADWAVVGDELTVPSVPTALKTAAADSTAFKPHSRP